jgi:hypothetical protein
MPSSIISGSGLTCSQVRSLGQTVSSLDVATLQTLADTDFPNCAYQLGRIRGFSTDQWQALASQAKRVSHDSDFFLWHVMRREALQIRDASRFTANKM